ncbi:hypothetical protein SAMN05661008_01490 [Alkalithermobacter thermoalcaliphilus JW-YL-7 = DSM 7308]|uniref:Lipoprotein n=1 Tax=Alkalithermobacter thermoalcaliphilus JW-YL-7 = DSM 7308 TaxID=1121328 RepID=A0A150FSP1_CLOPD|nr:hypothetical protein JWYL7_1125 [[Clostridium] paradoxum JW-YL-7 = DSM 7308]SHL12289.1 hypothetical protein SAMN05661008_01490 [[Clostridium] paradoxum JW-YL-7 = DSM 7308]
MKTMKKRLILLLCGIILVGIVGCESNKKEIPKLIFDEAVESTINELKEYEYVKDVHIQVSEEESKIVLTAVLSDSTNEKTAKEFADTLIRRFGWWVNFYNDVLEKGPNKDYYGELYDYYDINIGISSLSKVNDIKSWYVNKFILKGSHKQIDI